MADRLPISSPLKYTCEKCTFECSNKKDYNRHLLTAKHKRLTNTSIGLTQNPNEFVCICGKTYSHRQSLHKHKKKCIVVQTPSGEDNISNQFLKDEIIERLVKELGEERKAIMEKNNENQEMKSMFLMMIEKYQRASQEANQQLANTIVKGNQETTKELVNKFIELAPKMGNTTNNNDNRKITFNYYLTNHCKDAETIHEFIDRYSIKCGDYFRENARAIVDRQVSLGENARRIFFECLRENPQHMNFVQTSNVHDGIHYVKEKERIRENDIMTLCGEAEFRKYTDKFQKKGGEISRALQRVLRVIEEEVYERFHRKCRKRPLESDYEGQYSDYATEYTRDMEDYNRQYENSSEHNFELKSVLMQQILSVINQFDTSNTIGKKTCKEILEVSRSNTDIIGLGTPKDQ
jgi:hypothetical protein